MHCNFPNYEKILVIPVRCSVVKNSARIRITGSLDDELNNVHHKDTFFGRAIFEDEKKVYDVVPNPEKVLGLVVNIGTESIHSHNEFPLSVIIDNQEFSTVSSVRFDSSIRDSMNRQKKLCMGSW